ncbi:hypothetical protein RYH80_18385 [Halobaculum sp. MBLA0147]|uniref:hypothetical protein n=1 Tax=Halobaculum sp. MBLA0147 TaxID=3079934 RepID=UPI003523E994
MVPPSSSTQRSPAAESVSVPAQADFDQFFRDDLLAQWEIPTARALAARVAEELATRLSDPTRLSVEIIQAAPVAFEQAFLELASVPMLPEVAAVAREQLRDRAVTVLSGHELGTGSEFLFSVTEVLTQEFLNELQRAFDARFSPVVGPQDSQ